MVMDRRGEVRKHLRFRDILEELPPRSLLVLNDAKVLAARLHGRKPTGGAVEFLLTRRVREESKQNGGFRELWEGLTRGLGGTAAVPAIEVGGGVSVELVERHEAGRALLRLTGPGASLLGVLDGVGEVPLPPYIEAARKRLGAGAPSVDDRVRYQTVYAAHPGAVAAPTAGLHFTPELIAKIAAAGHEIATITLDVGPGTFRPVEVEDRKSTRLNSSHLGIS